MSFFSKILDKLGIKSANASAPAGTATPAPAPSAAPSAAPSPATSQAAAPAAAAAVVPPAAAAAPAVNPIPVVDVVAQLEKRAAANRQKLNWRTSIVDLLKLLDLDSSLEARKQLARELYCPDDLMGDSAKMNMWLHKNVLAHIAANGGNIPKELTD